MAISSPTTGTAMAQRRSAQSVKGLASLSPRTPQAALKVPEECEAA